MMTRNPVTQQRIQQDNQVDLADPTTIFRQVGDQQECPKTSLACQQEEVLKVRYPQEVSQTCQTMVLTKVGNQRQKVGGAQGRGARVVVAHVAPLQGQGSQAEIEAEAEVETIQTQRAITVIVIMTVGL